MNGFARTTATVGAVLSLDQALAVTRGEEPKYRRYVGPLVLHLVLNDANLIMWIPTNLCGMLHSTSSQQTADCHLYTGTSKPIPGARAGPHNVRRHA